MASAAAAAGSDAGFQADVDAAFDGMSKDDGFTDADWDNFVGSNPAAVVTPKVAPVSSEWIVNPNWTDKDWEELTFWADMESYADQPCPRWVDKPTRRLDRKTLSWKSFDNYLNDAWYKPWDPRPLEEVRARQVLITERCTHFH